MVTVTNIGSSNFGSVHFHIEYDNTISSANKFIVVPVNVVFKDDSNHCTLCEKTFYFYYSASDNRFVVVE